MNLFLQKYKYILFYDLERHSTKLFSSVFKTTTWRNCFFIIHWFISMNMRDIEALSTQQKYWQEFEDNHLAKLFFYNTLIHFNEHERYRGSLNKIVFIGFQNNHFAKLLFYNTLIHSKEHERYRGSLHSTKLLAWDRIQPLGEMVHYTLNHFNEHERHRGALHTTKLLAWDRIQPLGEIAFL